MKHQEGYIWRKGRSWHGRWWEDMLEDGRIVHKQRSRKLADYCDRYRYNKDVRPLLDEILRPINEGRSDARSTMPVGNYIEDHYLPWAKDNLKPSTYHGYKFIYRRYLAPRLGKTILRDYRTVDATNLLAEIHHQTGIRRKQLRHIKAFLSTVFTHAKQQGVLDASNPIRDVGIPRTAEPSGETHAASLKEALAMLDALNGQARTAVALIYFCGLRPGEARGARWEDFDGTRLRISQSVWRRYTTAPKTESSKACLPVIEPLRSILAEQREADGNPKFGPILRGPKNGTPLNLHNLACRVVVPALKARGIPWHGWYALRRGIASKLDQIAKRPVASSILLRHADPSTTLKHYIKPDEREMLEAMSVLEELCNHRATEQVQ